MINQNSPVCYTVHVIKFTSFPPDMENIVADISHVASTSHDEMYIFGAQPHIIRAQVCILLKPIYTWYDSFMVVIEKLLYSLALSVGHE